MSYLVLKKKPKKPPQTQRQATFKEHLRKIDQLKNRLKAKKQKYEEVLAIYLSDVRPKEEEVGKLIIQCTLKLIDLTKDPKVLNKDEQETLKMLLEENVNMIFAVLLHEDIPDAIHDLRQEIYGMSFAEEFQKNFKEVLKQFPEAKNLDLSNIQPGDSEEEIMNKLDEALNRVKIELENDSTRKQKSKKELLKEKATQDLEEIQNKSLNSIYKRLAKEIHPDLEQDIEKRAEKDKLMKRLTAAYENHDLLDLLTIESEWLNCFDGVSKVLDEETLKVYNSILKDQIEDLKNELYLMGHDPHYAEIFMHFDNFPENPTQGLRNSIIECDSLFEEFSEKLKNLSANNPLKNLKQQLNNFNNEFFLREIFNLAAQFDEN